MGIMMPITMSTGIERARTANREDERFAMEKETHGLSVQKQGLGMRKDQMLLDEAEQDAPVRQMERDAKKISHMAQFLSANIDRVDDADLNDYVAQGLSEMPAFGKVEVRNGQLFDGQKTMPMDRKSALKLLQALSDPKGAMQLKMQEQRYINEQGKVETMTRGEAQERGLGTADDQTAGYTLNKARIGDQYAEEDAKLGIDTKRQQLQNSRLEGIGKGDMQFVSPDRTQVKTMGRQQGLGMGWTPHKDYEATKKLPKLGTEDSPFSDTTPHTAWKSGLEQTLSTMGFMPAKQDNEGNVIAWSQVGPDGSLSAPMSPQDHAEAVKITDMAFELVSSGTPVKMPDGRTRYFSTVPEAVQVLAALRAQKKAGPAKKTAAAKAAAQAAMGGKINRANPGN